MTNTNIEIFNNEEFGSVRVLTLEVSRGLWARCGHSAWLCQHEGRACQAR